MPNRLGDRIRRVQIRYEASLRLLPILYFVWTVLVGSVIAWVTPPWQNADEPTHMMRIVQISLGELLGTATPRGGGGLTDPTIVTALHPFERLPFHDDAKLTGRDAATAAGVRWGQPVVWDFGNTAAYPPFLYAAAVPAAWIGRLGRMKVIETLRLVRVFNVVGAAFVGAFALAFARRTHLAIATVLVLPMTLSLAASASQDALMIPAACLMVALIDKARQSPTGATRWVIGWVAFALFAIVAARPPYLPLITLPVLLANTTGRRWLWLVGGLAAAVACWLLHVRGLGYPTLQADPSAQAKRLFHHPAVFAQVVAATLTLWWTGYIEGVVGTFGWLDTHLPLQFTDYARWVIPLSLASAATPDANRRSWSRWVALLAALGSGVALFLSMYLIWSPLRSPIVLGIQGRYFLPLLPALALGMPNLGRWAAVLRPPALVAVLLLAAIGPAVTVTTLVDRYYLIP